MSERTRFSRRQFLTAIVGLASISLVDTNDQIQAQSGRAKLRQPVLSEQELNDLKIRVNQGRGTQLFLTEDIFKLPLFQAVQRGNLNGIVISLVEAKSLSFRSTSYLPEDARAFWHIREHPNEYTEAKWADLIRREEYSKDAINRSLQMYAEELPLVGNSADRERIEREIAIRTMHLNDSERKIEIYNNRPAAIEHLETNGDEVGFFGMSAPNPPQAFLDNIKKDRPRVHQRITEFLTHKDWLNKAYVYISVGGPRTPSPEQSYPKTSDFDVDNSNDPIRYSVRPKSGFRSPGFTLRHEFAHYVVGGNENQADRTALESLNLGYPLLFVNHRGITIA